MKWIYPLMAVLLLFAACNKSTGEEPRPEPEPDPPGPFKPSQPKDTLVLERLSGDYQLRVSYSYEWYMGPDKGKSDKRSFDTSIHLEFGGGSVLVTLRYGGADNLSLVSESDTVLRFTYESFMPKQYKSLDYYRKEDSIVFRSGEFIGHGYQEFWSAYGIRD